MRNVTTRAAIAALALVTIASAQLYLPGHYFNNADVRFVHNAGPAGLVAVYVNGELIEDHMFAGQSSMFTRPMAIGNHKVAVVRAGQPLATGLIFEDDVEVERTGTFNLVFQEDVDIDPDTVNHAFEFDLAEAAQ